MKAVQRFMGGVVYWAPVWVSLLMLWQVAVRGLKPALAEEARLDAEAEAVELRHAHSQAEFQALEQEARAWQDPVYRERRRRMLETEGR